MIEPAKKVVTKDHSGKENGWLMELFKKESKTEVYLTASLPGSFKGYHLHRVRAGRFICIKGKTKVIIYTRLSGRWERSEYILDSQDPHRLEIPPRVAVALETIGEDEAWLINYPSPAYDPDLIGEQVEYTQEELEMGIVK